MPEDPIMDMVNNVEELYTSKTRLFDRWLEEGDAWSEIRARREALSMARKFAGHIQDMEGVRGRYSLKEIRRAADEMMEEFSDYREEAIKAVTERPRAPVERPPMGASEAAHAAKYEDLARKIGIGLLSGLIPASQERVRRALETGDFYLNTIPLYKWDDAAVGIPGEHRLTPAEKVSLLKHVAIWHYA